MEKLSMCRVCLGEDIRLVPIVGTHLQETYESLVLMPFETEDGRPILACYICRARLKNCYELRKSCLQSEELFTQMLSCNEPEQMHTQAINNKKRLTMHNVIHFSVGHELGMDADNVGVEALKCEVKVEPNEDKVISEDVPEENSVSDDVLSADSDAKNEESMGHELEMDADSVGVETLFVSCDVKDEQSDPEGDSAQKEPTLDVQRGSEDSTSRNLNGHELFQDAFKILHEVTAADITDGSKEKTASVQYTCDTCQQCYSSMCELERHVCLCSNVWKKDLSHVNITNHTRDHIKTYMRTHTGEKPYDCGICKKQFTLKGNLIIHLRTHTGEKPYNCGICMKRFSHKSNIITHMRTHTGEKPYNCGICKKQFTQKEHLKIHLHKHTGEKPYKCDRCKKKFSQRSSRTVHMRTHTRDEKTCYCDICMKQFSQKSHIKSHMRTHTNEKPYNHDICKKQFLENTSLTKHIRTHTGEKPYNCDICKKKFSLRSTFTVHMRTHSGENPCHCDICKKQFSKKSDLKRHMRMHTGEKPYHCGICKKQFSDKDSLLQHMRTYTGVKLYHCDICKKRISQKSHFTTHNNMHTHTGEEPYLCDICKKQLSDPSPVFKKPSNGLKTYSVVARRRQSVDHQS